MSHRSEIVGWSCPRYLEHRVKAMCYSFSLLVLLSYSPSGKAVLFRGDTYNFLAAEPPFSVAA
jgi:hypothetical protein